MTQIIQPIFEKKDNQLLCSTKHRFLTMFAPIQQIKDKEGSIKKHSDFIAYVATPFIDLVLETAFVIDASIHLLNACASLAKALYIWSIKQSENKQLIDNESAQECKSALSSFLHAESMIVAQFLNSAISFISLFTRPIASVIHAISAPKKTADAPPPYPSLSPNGSFNCAT